MFAVSAPEATSANKTGSRIDVQFVLASLLALLSFICYVPSLFCGFMCDDYFQIAYFFHRINTQPSLLLQNFVTCWGQNPLWGLHYRPLMLLPHLFDCLVWGYNPFGNHLTNIAIHCGCTVLVFLLARKLLNSLAGRDGFTIPLLCGALFATHPLHAESVTWISGRVDSFCSVFYLASFLCFLSSISLPAPQKPEEVQPQKPARRLQMLRIASLCLAFSAMLTKEIAITLPAVLTWYCLCLNYGSLRRDQALISALKETRAYWAVAAIYLAIRTAALGTIYGGYMGFAGEAIETSWRNNFFRWDAFQPVLLPVQIPMAHSSEFLICLLCLQVAMGIAIMLRIVNDGLDSKFVKTSVFLFGWILMSTALVARVWCVASGLPGGRHFYLVSVPFCILFVFLIVPSATKTKTSRLLRRSAVLLLSIYCAVLGAITIQQHELWAAASRYTKAIQDSVSSYLHSAPQTERVVLLNIPRTFHGLGVCPNFLSLSGLFAEPLCSPDLTKHIASLRPYFFNPDLINNSALEYGLSKSKVLSWNADERLIKPVPATSSTDYSILSSLAEIKSISETSDVSAYSIRPIKPIHKNAIDCVEIVANCASASTTANDPTIMLSWIDEQHKNSDDGALVSDTREDGSVALSRYDKSGGSASSLAIRLLRDGKSHVYRFHLSELTSWVLSGNTSQLNLIAWPGNIKISSARFLNLGKEIPTISTDEMNWLQNQDGTFSPKPKSAPTLVYDASKLVRATHVVAEISLPYEFFEYVAPSYRQPALSTRSRKLVSNGSSGTIALPSDLLNQSAEYEIRIAALDGNEKMIGYVSDPITIRTASTWR